jgi:hypothetical protein
VNHIVKAAKMISIEDLRGAVARGWCSAENSYKEMDSTLADAIVTEVHAALNAESQKPSHNTGSPKLPSFFELYEESHSRMIKEYVPDQAYSLEAKAMYDVIIEKLDQLRAGA